MDKINPVEKRMLPEFLEAEDWFFELTTEAKKKLTSCGAATNVGSASLILAGEGKEVTVGGIALRPGSGICDECFIRGAFPEVRCVRICIDVDSGEESIGGSEMD
ncbi:unnamed protein product [Peronospora destructor]|uniref:Cytidine deaminase n=1 Tax=Peronospora destructor TaxID=86335 RepID=A0AAV0U6K3_9STRA|nr:unnamed protein product [Peronospora destructor]